MSLSACASSLRCASSGDTQEREPARGQRAHRGRVLAYAARKHQRVEAAQCRGHRGDPGAQPVDIDIQRQARAGPSRPAAARARRSRACRRCPPGPAGQSGARARRRAPPPEQLLVLEQPQQHPGVDAARAGRHHETLERREAHRGVERGPVVDRAQRGAGAQVAAHDPQPRSASPEQLRRAPRDPGVREAVKAVAAQPPALAPLCRQRIGGAAAGRVA